MNITFKKPNVEQTTMHTNRKFMKMIRPLAKKAGAAFPESDKSLFHRMFVSNPKASTVTFVAVLGEEGLPILRQAMNNFDSVKELDGVHIVALWVEKDGKQGLFLSLRKHLCTVNQESLNAGNVVRILNELKQFGREKDISTLAPMDPKTCADIHSSLEQFLQKRSGLSRSEMMHLLYYNSQKEIERCYKNYVKEIYPAAEDCCNAEWFGNTYYWEIKIMRDVFAGSGRGISVHDVGTNTGHFPLLLARLKKEELMGVDISRIIASDIIPDVPRMAIGNALKKENISIDKVEIIYLDLIKEMNTMPETDVIVANDVLEHFPEEMSLSLLQGLWSRTKKLLFIHLPIEEIPSTEFGHTYCINGEKIRKWVSTLTGGVCLSEQYAEPWGTLLADQGFIVMMK